MKSSLPLSYPYASGMPACYTLENIWEELPTCGVKGGWLSSQNSERCISGKRRGEGWLIGEMGT